MRHEPGQKAERLAAAQSRVGLISECRRAKGSRENKSGNVRIIIEGSREMKKFMQKFLGDKAGASAAEYALILAVVGIGVAAAFGTLGSNIDTVVNDAANRITVAP